VRWVFERFAFLAPPVSSAVAFPLTSSGVIGCDTHRVLQNERGNRK
jgi:hypothetical protein